MTKKIKIEDISEETIVVTAERHDMPAEVVISRAAIEARTGRTAMSRKSMLIHVEAHVGELRAALERKRSPFGAGTRAFIHAGDW